MNATYTGPPKGKIQDEEFFTVKEGGIAVTRRCLFCDNTEIVRKGLQGVGRGYGMREGNKARGRAIQHVKSAHPEEYASAKERSLERWESLQPQPAHTPGPWRTDPSWPGCVFSEDRHATPLASADYLDGDDEDIANARLIAAAPDLLSSLREVLEMLDEYNARGLVLASPSNNRVTSGIENARDAIVKAEGSGE
jgi:hypothetical protein